MSSQTRRRPTGLGSIGWRCLHMPYWKGLGGIVSICPTACIERGNHVAGLTGLDHVRRSVSHYFSIYRGASTEERLLFRAFAYCWSLLLMAGEEKLALPPSGYRLSIGYRGGHALHTWELRDCSGSHLYDESHSSQSIDASFPVGLGKVLGSAGKPLNRFEMARSRPMGTKIQEMWMISHLITLYPVTLYVWHPSFIRITLWTAFTFYKFGFQQ